jgi:hypothetical protein
MPNNKPNDKKVTDWKPEPTYTTKVSAKEEKPQKDWSLLPGEKPQDWNPVNDPTFDPVPGAEVKKPSHFTLPEPEPWERTQKELEEKYPTNSGMADFANVSPEPVVPVVVDRAEVEKRLGGKFEDVANEPGRRSNQKFETYSNGSECYVYVCPRGSKPPTVSNSWENVARLMGV